MTNSGYVSGVLRLGKGYRNGFRRGTPRMVSTPTPSRWRASLTKSPQRPSENPAGEHNTYAARGGNR